MGGIKTTATAQPITPRPFDSVGGFLGQRFHANHEKRLKDPLLSEEFIRLRERKAHTISRWTTACDDWFWLGKQVGKWSDVSQELIEYNRS